MDDIKDFVAGVVGNDVAVAIGSSGEFAGKLVVLVQVLHEKVSLIYIDSFLHKLSSTIHQ